ncbi:MAG: hypothetical protein ACFCGT_23140 [Sandaracinaceae bacterium]
MSRRHAGLVAGAALVAAWLASPASADVFTYLGPHPVDLAGTWHSGAEPHDHGELPVGGDGFGTVGGARVFLGDPVSYGWSGPVWTYRNSHPIGGLGLICDVRGEHRHPFAPEGEYREDDGVFTYRGALRGGWAVVRPRRVQPRRPVAAPPGPGPAPVLVAPCVAAPALCAYFRRTGRRVRPRPARPARPAPAGVRRMRSPRGATKAVATPRPGVGGAGAPSQTVGGRRTGATVRRTGRGSTTSRSTRTRSTGR